MRNVPKVKKETKGLPVKSRNLASNKSHEIYLDYVCENRLNKIHVFK